MKQSIIPSNIHSWNRLVLHNLEGEEDIKTSQAAAQTTPEAGFFGDLFVVGFLKSRFNLKTLRKGREAYILFVHQNKC